MYLKGICNSGVHALQIWRTVSVKHLPSISSPTQVDWCEPCAICKWVNVSFLCTMSAVWWVNGLHEHRWRWDGVIFWDQYKLQSINSICVTLLLNYFGLIFFERKKIEKTYNGSEWGQFLEELKISKIIMFDESVKVYHSEWLINELVNLFYEWINKQNNLGWIHIVYIFNILMFIDRPIHFHCKWFTVTLFFLRKSENDHGNQYYATIAVEWASLYWTLIIIRRHLMLNVIIYDFTAWYTCGSVLNFQDDVKWNRLGKLGWSWTAYIHRKLFWIKSLKSSKHTSKWKMKPIKNLLWSVKEELVLIWALRTLLWVQGSFT